MLKDVMVHLDGSADDGVRLERAESVAVQFGAHLTGLLTIRLPTPFITMEESAAAAAIVSEMAQRAREEGDTAGAKVQSRLQTVSCPNALRRIDGVSGDLERRAVAEARAADLVVALRPYGTGRKTVWVELVEALLFGTGRAILLQPPDGKATMPIRRPFVCWNESREATRAIAEAMPFLRAAQSVVLAMVDPDTGSGSEWQEPGAAMARHLARHDVKAELMSVAAGSHASADALLRAAESRGADLIVLGGYGHSRLREWALGGVTRDMLSSAHVPVLIAH